MTERIEIQITRNDNRRRLEDFLCDRFSGLSKMYLREIVKSEKCEVNGRFENRGYRIRSNDLIEIELDIARRTSMKPENIPLDIVFEDGHLIVVNKPCGMLSHPSHRENSGTLLNALTFYLNTDCGQRPAEKKQNNGSQSPVRTPQSVFLRPGLIHRLDKQTSGLMVIAKNARAHRILSSHFQRRLVEKRYLALVDGIVPMEKGSIEGEIGRYAEEKQWGLKDDGKRSETRFWVRERYAESTLLELEPVTGRTNQLRIHCASIGHPITGDVKRGGREYDRLCLHAYKLSFRHPNDGTQLIFEIEANF